MNLIDLSVLGKRFTWFKPDGSAMSRVGRFLLSEGWINMWSISAQWVRVRDVSDHCPIMLKGENTNWGPKPFRFNNCWLQHVDFKSFVEGSWADLQVAGRNIYRLKEKLEQLKVKIKEWNSLVFGNLDTQINNLAADLNVSDGQASIRDLTREELHRRRQTLDDLWRVQKMKDSLLFQKARVRR